MPVIIRNGNQWQGRKAGLGDRIERLVKPIARVLHLPCLEPDDSLKPESPCAKARDKINKAGNSLAKLLKP